MDNERNHRPKSVEWKDGELVILDQTKLPGKTEYIVPKDIRSVWEAIRRLSVRGAPAIGVAAAYGVVVGVRNDAQPDLYAVVSKACDYLATSRPTAVNLFWALDRMRAAATNALGNNAGREELLDQLLREAHAIRDEDAAMCLAIGEHGLPLFFDGCRVLTHCNAGALATSDYGTALAPIYLAHERGRDIAVYADETRPLLQGARLTAWELALAGIKVTVICDNMAAVLMQKKRVDFIIVGADRIAANGDTANKIGTYGLAVLAAHHDVPFYVAAPSSTFDPEIATGDDIPIEQRDGNEVRAVRGVQIAPPDVAIWNPAFDVTPAELIRGIITENGIIEPPFENQITRRTI